MNRSLTFICAALRDVHTIVEYADGHITHLVRDKITGASKFVDDDKEDCLALLNSDPEVKSYSH